jgi:hypothetical protein
MNKDIKERIEDLLAASDNRMDLIRSELEQINMEVNNKEQRRYDLMHMLNNELGFYSEIETLIKKLETK